MGIVRPHLVLVNRCFLGQVRDAEAIPSASATRRKPSLPDQSPKVVFGVVRATRGFLEIDGFVILGQKECLHVGQGSTT